MEFTIEDKKLYMLQTRNGKRTAAAAMKIACDLVDEGMITEEEAVAHDRPEEPRRAAAPARSTRPPSRRPRSSARVWPPLPALPAARSSSRQRTATDVGQRPVRRSSWSVWRPAPEDIEGMHYAQGILTVRGGMTSHAAVVARGMGTCCVSGCGAIKMDEANKKFELSAARPTTRATGSPSTAPPATSTAKRSRPLRLPSPATSTAS